MSCTRRTMCVNASKHACPEFTKNRNSDMQLHLIVPGYMYRGVHVHAVRQSLTVLTGNDGRATDEAQELVDDERQEGD